MKYGIAVISDTYKSNFKLTSHCINYTTSHFNKQSKIIGVLIGRATYYIEIVETLVKILKVN